MTDWEKALKFVGIAEGGRNFDIVNGKPVLNAKNKNDAGGPTVYGITWGTLKAAYKDGLVSHDDITKLTKEEADKIYEVRYWRASHADDMAWPLSLCHFDASVNLGLGGAAKILQRALNKMGSTLRVDSAIGPLTLKEVSKYDPKEVSRQELAQRVNYYLDIVKRKPSQKDFLNGWLKRTKNLEKEVG